MKVNIPIPDKLSDLLFFTLHYLNILLITLIALIAGPYCARQLWSADLFESERQKFHFWPINLN